MQLAAGGAVKGQKSIFSPVDNATADVLATFGSDGAPAVTVLIVARPPSTHTTHALIRPPLPAKTLRRTWWAIGSPQRRQHGLGYAVYAGFYIGLSYFDPAIPKRPPCRGSTDQTYNHWIPTDFDVEERTLLSSVIDEPRLASCGSAARDVFWGAPVW
eukprot:SAG11_NODE_4024_length_2101_cov_1.093906_1_plen_157_part_10